MRAPKSTSVDVEAYNAIYKEVVIIGISIDFCLYLFKYQHFLYHLEIAKNRQTTIYFLILCPLKLHRKWTKRHFTITFFERQLAVL